MTMVPAKASTAAATLSLSSRLRSTMAGVRLVATRRFAVYGSAGESGLGDGPALEQSSSSTSINNNSRSARAPYGAAGGGASAMAYEKDGAEIEVPTMRLRELNKSNASRFVGLMEKHGFVVLTEVGVIRKAYLEFMQLLKAFFEGDSDWKETKKGGVHFNERGIPMWHTGYERCGRVREAFRIPTDLAHPSSSSSSSSSCSCSSISSAPMSSLDPWPCHHLRLAWLAVLRHLQLVCHRALTLTLARPVRGGPRPVRAFVRGRPPAASSRSEPAEVRPPGQTQGEERGGGGGGGEGEGGGGGGGRGGGRGGGGKEANRKEACWCPVGSGIDRLAAAAPREALKVAVWEADTAAAVAAAAAIMAGVTGEKEQAGGRAGDVNDLQGSGEQGSGERGSGERCPVCLSQAAGGGVSNAEGGDGDAGGDAEGDDFSVSYALHYPNEFADPALETEDLTVGEHVDPSLFVAEPCCGVEGLEILDRASKSWLPVEALCAGLGANGKHSLEEAEGRELVLFGGKALERATEGRVRGAPHRVRRGRLGRRYCFIYEQKYADFFPPPALD